MAKNCVPQTSVPEIKEGTVLAIPLIRRKWALGQIIAPGTNFYLGVVLKVFVEPITANDIEGKSLKLFSWTNDAELFKGRWENLGICSLQEFGILPEYKVSVDGKIVVKSFFGDKCRDFDPDVDRNLQYRTSRSPLLVEDAVRAACGLGTWKPYYDRMMR